MDERTREILIDLGEEGFKLHGVGRVALEHGAIAGPEAIAFEVALWPIGANRLKIARKGMRHDTGEQGLERLATLAQKGILNLEPIGKALRVVQLVPRI